MNKAILMGRLTRDPEVRYSNNEKSTAVCRFTLAIDRKFQKQGEEKQADFIPVVAFGKTGEFCGKYFGKGRKIMVCGAIQTRTWDDKKKKKHYVTEVIADEVDFADSKKGEGSGAREPGEDDSLPPPQDNKQQTPPPEEKTVAAVQTQGGSKPPWMNK